MTTNNILLSKIVASPTDSAYAQVYSTLNLYIAIAIKQEEATPSITQKGKDVLEKLQREYFALDRKNLNDIHKAVSTAIEGLDYKDQVSIILATVTDNILYIIIANSGSVLIKRHDKMGIIATGEGGSVLSFSGKLENNDVIVLQTTSFAEKLSAASPLEKLSGAEITEISENLATLVHTNPEGTEAAVLLQYKTLEETPSVFATPPEENPKTETPEEEKTEEEEEQPKESSHKRSFKLPLFLPHVSMPLKGMHFSFKSKKFLLIPIIVILVILFLGGLMMDKKKKTDTANKETVQTVLAPAQKKYDEAVALMSLNKSLAIDSLNQAKQDLTAAENKFSSDSPEKKQVDELLKKVNDKLDEAGGGGSAKNQTVLLEGSKDVTTPASLTARGNILAVLDQDTGNVVELSKDGTISKTYTTSKNASLLTSDKTTYYVYAGDGVYSIDKKGKTGKKIFSPSGNYVGIDTFLGNVYLLTSADIEKYAPSAYEKAAYLKDTKLSETATSFTIDASVYVANDEGIIKKYTKGKDDTFSVKGLPTPLGKSLLLYADPEGTHVFIYDKNNFRLVVVKSTGEFESQVETSALKNVTSLAVMESSKKAYIIADHKIISFEF